MVADDALNPRLERLIRERLIRAWYDTETIRDMPELFSEEKLAQIANAAMVAIEEAWEALGHSRRELEDACKRLLTSGNLENWAGKKHVRLEPPE
jgi:hypothetical protein